jgi:hypothetical protein
VLPATGAPLALVERFVVDMTVPCVGWVEYFLAEPGRGADYVTEILWPDGGLLAGEHSGFDVAKGRLGLVEWLFGKCSVTVGKECRLDIAISTRVCTLSMIRRCALIEPNRNMSSFLFYNTHEM